MLRRFWSLLKAPPKFMYSCLKRCYSALITICEFVCSRLKEIALLLVCCYLMVNLLIIAVDSELFLSPPRISSRQMEKNLPHLIPSTKYDYQRSIVRLYVGEQFYCSGVVIGNNYLLTASHCLVDENGVMKNEEITVVNDDGTVRVKAKPAGVNRRMDWGLIEGDFSNIPGAMVAETNWQPLSRVVACGYPQGARALMCQILVPRMNDGFLIKCNVGAMIFPGMSGGPVFDANGIVVGLNVLVYPAEYGGGVAYSPITAVLANFHIADY